MSGLPPVARDDAFGPSTAAADRGRASDEGGRKRRRARPQERRHHAPLVLLVDDLEDQRELYREYLEFVGFRVEVARDGFDAIDQAQELRPDVVVMDLAMPGLDGFETTQRLKLLETTRAIPVIALTAHGELPREWAISAGCAAYLRKPCEPYDLALEVTSALRRAADAVPRPAEAPSPGGRSRVMVVDDHEDARDLFARYLDGLGYAVSVAADGDEALRDIPLLRPDIIVMDLDLPRLDGWEAIRRLKRDPLTRGIPIIAVSGHVYDADREQAWAAGCSAFLSKPCPPDTLHAEIERMLHPSGRSS
jgi:two-component system, cell cycle response regulator DivK